MPPVAVICLGLWPGEAMIRLERLAANCNAFDICDNAGARERGPIDAGGSAPRMSTLPLDTILTRLLAVGIPAHLSSTTGNFLCNALLYHSLPAIERLCPEVPCGSIHVPYLPEQVAEMFRGDDDAPSLEMPHRWRCTSAPTWPA